VRPDDLAQHLVTELGNGGFARWQAMLGKKISDCFV
jgi:hypothetical protein